MNSNDEFSKEHTDFISKHGDGVKDIAFTVENAEKTYKVAISRGAISVKEPIREEDDNGYVITASVKTYGDTIHTFVERSNFQGAFLPGFKAIINDDSNNNILGKTEYSIIDHIVGNHPLGDMEPTVQWYEKMLDFHRFWSVDDSVIHTEFR